MKTNSNLRGTRRRLRRWFAALALLGAVAGTFFTASAQTAPATAAPSAAADKPYLVEWVYRIKYGFKDEWWAIFRKYQIGTLDREKDLGYVTDYQVFGPGLHTSEESRWDYRVIITYKNQAAAGHGGEIERQLFPDKAARVREENRRWELTTNHWDLPIHVVDPHAE